MPYFRSIDRYADCVWLLHKYEAHNKGLPICFSEVQVKNDVTDNNNKHFVTAFEGECRNIIELREHLKLCFLVILGNINTFFYRLRSFSLAFWFVRSFPTFPIIKQQFQFGVS